ncbi:hypothetical protein PJF56_04780 [Roseofilum sp. BLCC_M91]|uniref:Calx-beta domain-containing protein n=1 Tax=Roseofilum halophilum BLCC-M91 TaxID=3022259 RepID=A0ABT7BG67_9CYAN|nr:hypothetical protein [Roseofilum halophilum]MDJ1178173.1 hypothetical protein [Roseofilum halophilum BLCC-M91]
MAVINGMPGNNFIVGTPASDQIFLLAGNDTVFSQQGGDLIFGNFGNDLLSGNENNDSIFGEQGNDILIGNQDEDLMNGNQGNDTLYGGQGNDILYGGQDSDLVFGDRGNDVLHGDLGADGLIGGDGQDIFVMGRRNVFGQPPTTGGPLISDADIADDFVDGQDLLGLEPGLAFEHLSITAGTGPYTGTTVIQDLVTSNYLMILPGVNPNQITEADFTTNLNPIPVPTPPPTPTPTPTPTPIPPPQPSTVSVEATTNIAVEGDPATNGIFTLTRTGGSTEAALTVNYTVQGTAENGTRYQLLNNSVTIPAGAATVELPVVPINNDIPDGVQDVSITLSNSGFYIVGTPNTAQVKILEDDWVYVDDNWATLADGTAVDPDGDGPLTEGDGIIGINAFAQIQGGINRVSVTPTGSLVQVLPGMYIPGQVININKPVQLLGPNANQGLGAARNPEATIGGAGGFVEFDRAGSPAGPIIINGFEFTSDGVAETPVMNLRDPGSEVIIRSNTFTNLIEDGIFRTLNSPNPQGFGTLTVQDNQFDGITGNGKRAMFIYEVDTVNIVNNAVNNIGNPGEDAPGILLDTIGSANISGNRLNTVRQQGIQVAGVRAGGGTVTIENNQLENINTNNGATDGAIRLRESPFGATLSNAGSIVVQNNQVTGSNNGLAIRPGANLGTGGFLTVTNNGFAVNGGTFSILHNGTGTLNAGGNFSDTIGGTALTAANVGGTSAGSVVL